MARPFSADALRAGLGVAGGLANRTPGRVGVIVGFGYLWNNEGGSAGGP